MYQETNRAGQYEPGQEGDKSQDPYIQAPYGSREWGSMQDQGGRQKNYMSLASMILGILSIVTACCFFSGMALGGLAVFFAALSRVDVKMNRQGRTGLITGIIGILLGFASIILWISLSA